ncbi:MAG: hypothetical protein ACREBW_05595 [Candidatus Micrarchaeaceae archaeon]
MSHWSSKAPFAMLSGVNSGSVAAAGHAKANFTKKEEQSIENQQLDYFMFRAGEPIVFAGMGSGVD